MTLSITSCPVPRFNTLKTWLTSTPSLTCPKLCLPLSNWIRGARDCPGAGGEICGETGCSTGCGAACETGCGAIREAGCETGGDTGGDTGDVTGESFEAGAPAWLDCLSESCELQGCKKLIQQMIAAIATPSQFL